MNFIQTIVTMLIVLVLGLIGKKYYDDCKNEREYIKRLLDNIDNKIIRSHLENNLNWYTENTYKNKLVFYFFSITSIVLTASIPIVNLIDGINTKLVTSILSGSAGIIATILALSNVKAGWIRCRKTSELLKRECFLYLEKACKYSNIEENNREELFANSIDEIILHEVAKWEISKIPQNDSKKGKEPNSNDQKKDS